MNKNIKKIVYHGNRILNQPLTIIIVLILLFAYFAVGNTQFEKENRDILNDTHATVDNSQTIIKNLQAAVTDLKADNARQTRFIECILALHGANVQIDADVQVQCVKMSQSVDLENVTSPPPSDSQKNKTSNPTIPQQPNNQGQGNQNPPQSNIIQRTVNRVEGLGRWLGGKLGL